jgi:hypothetical protein
VWVLEFAGMGGGLPGAGFVGRPETAEGQARPEGPAFCEPVEIPDL